MSTLAEAVDEAVDAVLAAARASDDPAALLAAAMSRLTLGPVPLAEWQGARVLAANIPEDRPGVYGLCCLATGKWYVGRAEKSLARRLKDHIRGGGYSSSKLRHALEEYNWSFWVVVPLAYSLNGIECLPEIEDQLIRDYNSLGDGYNQLSAAGSKTSPTYLRHAARSAKKKPPAPERGPAADKIDAAAA